MRTVLLIALLLAASTSFARAQNGGSIDLPILGSTSSPPSCLVPDGGRAPCATSQIVCPPAQVRVEYHNHVYYVSSPHRWKGSRRHGTSSKRPPAWAKRYRHEGVQTWGVLKKTTQATLDQTKTNTKVLKDIRGSVNHLTKVQKEQVRSDEGFFRKFFWTIAGATFFLCCVIAAGAILAAALARR